MNNLETRLKETLQRRAAVEPQTMPAGTPARVRVRRTGTAMLVSVALILFIVGVALVVPRGVRAIRRSPAAGANRSGAPESWPKVVIGDPAGGYVGPKDNQDVLGQKSLLTSGTVDGHAFSLVGYSQRPSGTCLELAGPATSDRPPFSPGPYPPGATAPSGGVGGYCSPDQITLRAMGWPDFPNSADIFMRGLGGAYMGFVTERVATLEIVLTDGAVVDVPVLHFPNEQNFGAFIFFPSTVAISGDVLALDAGGTPVAQAALCGPDDGTHACDVAPVKELLPMPSSSASG